MAVNAPSYADVVKNNKDVPNGDEPAVGTSTQVDIRSKHSSTKKEQWDKNEPKIDRRDSESLVKSTVPVLLIWGFILSLIFGGCCSNVRRYVCPCCIRWANQVDRCMRWKL
jgi:hypothetical protein